MIARRVERSATRDIGPSAQRVSLDLWEVARLDLGPQPLCFDSPLGPQALIVAGSSFMLREVEASLAKWASITFNTEKMLITWFLPAGKSDPKGFGKRRSWGCLCPDLPGSTAEPCPYHALLKHSDGVSRILRISLDGLSDLPVFPTSVGNGCSKRSVVAAVQEV